MTLTNVPIARGDWFWLVALRDSERIHVLWPPQWFTFPLPWSEALPPERGDVAPSSVSRLSLLEALLSSACFELHMEWGTQQMGLGAGLDCTHPRFITIFAFLLVSTSSWIRENGGSSSQDNGRELLRKLLLQVCTLQQTSLSSTLSYSRLPVLQICSGFLLTLFFGGCLFPYLGIRTAP